MNAKITIRNIDSFEFRSFQKRNLKLRLEENVTSKCQSSTQMYGKKCRCRNVELRYEEGKRDIDLC